MNHETIGTHTIGKVIGLYRASAERCKEIVEALEEIQEAHDSLRLAKEDLRLAINDGDDAEEIKRYEDKVVAYQNDFKYVFDNEIEGIRARARNLIEDMEFGSEKVGE